jgi:hypothetical protein
MASIALATPDIARLDDIAGTRIEIPHLLTADRSHGRDEALVQFDGDTYPTAYRGVHKSRTLQCNARFPGREAEHADLLALLDLFDSCFDATDGRLLLRTNRGLVAGLDPIEVVTVSSWTEPRLVGLVYDVGFTATRVEHTIEV